MVRSPVSASKPRSSRLGWFGPGLAVVLGVVVMFGTPSAASSPASGSRVDGAADPATRTVFLRDCAICHGSDAAGTSRGPTLQGVGRANVDYQLTTGRMPLPPLDDRWDPDHPTAQSRRGSPAYGPATISALVDYVATIAPGGPDIPQNDVSSANLSRGGALFRAQCAGCHEWAGEGGALQYGAAPSLDKATPTQIAEAVRVGPATMPVFGEAALNSSDLANLVGFVRNLRTPDDAGGLPLWHLGPLVEGAAALAALALVVIALRMIGTRT